MSCENCKLELRIDEAEANIKELQRDRNDSNIKFGKMETTLEYIKIAVDNLTKKVEEIASAPKKRWDLVINTIITVIIAALITAIMSGVLK